MAIYDCFQYFNEDHVIDIRLNILDKYVDYFVISESIMTHQGEKKKLNFDIKNFPKFKNKIKYIVADFNKKKNFTNHKWGESIIEQHQRNSVSEGIKKASDGDLIILSDSDEIPDLTKLKEIKKSVKFIAFSQMMFMYKINLQNLDESIRIKPIRRIRSTLWLFKILDISESNISLPLFLCVIYAVGIP